jgi:glycosyltransferase involved in cell wall biosynthesis
MVLTIPPLCEKYEAMYPLILSVIIPVKNEAQNIALCIESFQAAVREGWAEILVIDNFSTDDTKIIAESMGVRAIQQGPERSTQRNRGWKEAQGDYIFFVDADMRVPEATLREVRGRIEQSAVGSQQSAVTSRQKSETSVQLPTANCQLPTAIDALYVREVRAGTSWWIKVRNFERSFYEATCIDGLRIIKRSILEQVDGYDENLFAAEDWDLDRRILAITSHVALTDGHLIHDEGVFSFTRHLKKKAYYSTNFSAYLDKWGHDAITRKQFGFFYRFFAVFFEQGKWKRALTHPHYMFAIWFERFCVGLLYLKRTRST